MRYILLLAGICSCLLAQAQRSVKYTGGIDGGLLLGDKTYNGFALLSQGVAVKQYRLSIGSGYDFYRLRSVPLFADVTKVLNGKELQPFVQLAAGMNIASPTGSEKKLLESYGDGSFKNGFFTRAGAGLILTPHKKVHFSLSAGFSYKSSTYTYKTTGNIQPYQTQSLRDNYYFKRWYIGAGMMW